MMRISRGHLMRWRMRRLQLPMPTKRRVERVQRAPLPMQPTSDREVKSRRTNASLQLHHTIPPPPRPPLPLPPAAEATTSLQEEELSPPPPPPLQEGLPAQEQAEDTTCETNVHSKWYVAFKTSWPEEISILQKA